MDYEQTGKEKRYESVYRTWADDIYKICLYYTKDKKKASDITLQTFLNCYKRFYEVDSNHIFAYLVREAKGLIAADESGEVSTEEVRV